MPRATDKRKPVGTQHCDDCGTLARFYQVQKGSRTGFLYRRCECGADQSTGAAKQARWLHGMTRTDEPMIPHPLTLERVQEPGPDPEPETPEPRASAEVDPENESQKPPLWGIAAMVGAVALVLFT